MVSTLSVTGTRSDRRMETTWDSSFRISCESLLGRAFAVEPGVEDDVLGPAGMGHPRRRQDPLLALEPFPAVLGIEVDEVGGVDAEADLPGRGLEGDLAGRVQAHLDAVDEFDLLAVQADLKDVFDPLDGGRIGARQGDARRAEEKRL